MGCISRPSKQRTEGRSGTSRQPWTTGAPLNQARVTHGGAECSGAIFVLGGWPNLTFTTALTDVERLDKVGGPWKKGLP
jgi:hypothetical protein